MPIVTVQQSPRDLERKRALVAGITQAFVDAYGVRPETVQVFIHEVDDENWAKGGKLAADGLVPASETTPGSGGHRSPSDIR
jgi:4-oxalocrotonate tautomerase